MKKLLLTLFSLFLFFACIENKTEIESNEQDSKEIIQVSKVIDTIYPDGAHYVGELKDNKKTGHGNCTYANGNIYTGEYENNLANGQGAYIGVNGDSYIGKWQDNKPNGEGTYTWGEGPHYNDVYVGEFKDGDPHGEGSYTWGSGTNKGDKYIGEFIDNKKTGHGICNYANGDIYVGAWKEGKSHGQGKFTTIDGRILEGLFENGEYIDSNYQSNLNPEDIIITDEDIDESKNKTLIIGK